MNLPGSRPLIAGLFLFALSAGLVSADDVLVNGQRPLTQPMVNDVSDFFEWLLEAPMTGIQRQQMQQSLVDSWNRGDEADIETTRDVLKLRADLAGVSEDERALIRVQLQREVLPALRQQPDDAMAQVLVGLYDAAHTPIAQGTPPLTRQMSDAHAEVLFFMLNEVAGGDVFELSRQFQDEWAQLLAAAYGTYGPAKREQMAQFPMYAAALRVAWPSLPDDERATLRDQWRAQLAELQPAEALAQAEPQPAQTPLRDRADQMSCDALLGLSREDEYGLTVSQSLTRLKCLNDRDRQEDANYPPAEQAARRLARSQANFGLASNVSNLQHQANMSIITNIGDNGWRYEYRPVP